VTPGNAATTKIIVFHFQSLVVVMMGGVQWTPVVSIFLSTTRVTNFSVFANPMECFFSDWEVILDGLVFLLLLPVISALLVSKYKKWGGGGGREGIKISIFLNYGFVIYYFFNM
jgi:hypothetical protein